MSATHDLLALCMQSGVPALLWGPPGSAKTRVTEAIARTIGYDIHTLIASLREPSDFGGLPVPSGDRVRMLPTGAWVYDILAHPERRHVIFLDEISTAPPAVQAALLRVVFDNAVGDVQLPPTVTWTAAANPTEQSAGGWDLTAPLANRFLHVQWPIDQKAWAHGMIAGFPEPRVPRLPSTWESAVPVMRSVVASFITHRPSHLLNVPKDAEAGRAWPSMRTWDMTARILAACDVAGASEETSSLAVAGCVGTGAALEFLAWRRDLDLPDPEALLADPDSFVPTVNRPDRVYAALAAVCAATIQNLTPSRWKAAWRVVHIAASKASKDMAIVAQTTLTAAGFNREDLVVPDATYRLFEPVLAATEKARKRR